MAIRNIFGTVDVKGVLDKWLPEIKKNYNGLDPTDKDPSDELKVLLIAKANNPYTIGYYDSGELPSYTRLVSSKESTIGYELRDQDIEEHDGKKYLTNIYNLSIRAENGEKIRWWGHTLNPNSSTQAVISTVHVPRSPLTPPEFRNLTRKNTSFWYASTAMNPEDLSKGIYVETRRIYCLECTLEGTVGTEVKYDIEILLLSGSFQDDEGDLISVPITKLVVDPSVWIKAKGDI